MDHVGVGERKIGRAPLRVQNPELRENLETSKEVGRKFLTSLDRDC
jgi:hypothetical protein